MYEWANLAQQLGASLLAPSASSESPWASLGGDTTAAPAKLHALLAHLFASTKGRAALAASRDLPPPVLAQLATDPIDEVRFAVAANPATPQELLLRMDDDRSCHCMIAANANAPRALLNRFARTWAPELRRAVARNPSAPEEALATLVADPDPQVRCSLARHPRAPRVTTDAPAGRSTLEAPPGNVGWRPKTLAQAALLAASRTAHGSARNGAPASELAIRSKEDPPEPERARTVGTPAGTPA